jgi:hypothetical protein
VDHHPLGHLPACDNQVTNAVVIPDITHGLIPSHIIAPHSVISLCMQLLLTLLIPDPYPTP